MDHDHWNDRRPATRCATGINPVAVSLANAPPSATPLSVMGLICSQLGDFRHRWLAPTMRLYTSSSGKPIAVLADCYPIEDQKLDIRLKIFYRVC
jgi:hypothetical protein